MLIPTQGTSNGLCLSRFALREQGPIKSIRGPSPEILPKFKFTIGSILRPTNIVALVQNSPSLTSKLNLVVFNLLPFIMGHKSATPNLFILMYHIIHT